MDIKLKQRLVGLTVIFSLAVIFLPMLLDGSGLAPKPIEIDIPPPPQIEMEAQIEERIIELEKETRKVVELQPVIVDEISDPPDQSQKIAGDKTQGETPPAKTPGSEPKVAEIDQKPAPAPAQTKKSNTPVAEPQSAKPRVVKKTVNKARPDASARDVAKKQTGGELWVIQTGSFQQKDKAYQQRDRIRKSRLAAVFIEKYQHNGKVNYRVRIGPFLTWEKANVVKNKVRAKYNIKAIVMRYEK